MMNKLFNKYTILCSSAVIILIVFLIHSIFKPTFTLKNEEKTIEYGQTLSLNIEDYLDTKKTKKDILSNIKMDTSKVSIVENKDYPAIGEYEIIFTYKNDKAILKLKVVDTTKPVFNDFKDVVEFTRDCKPSAEEFAKLFTATDLDSVTISVDDSKVDYSKEGKYTSTVKAVDGSKNEVSQDIQVVITAPTIELDKASQSKYVGENFVLSAKVVGKDEKITFKSSDSHIASVDSNGKVIANNKGNATITATANEVSAECKVTVKSKPSTSITTTTVTDSQTNKIDKTDKIDKIDKKEEVAVAKYSIPSGSRARSSSSVHDSVAMEYDLSKAKEAFDLQNAQRAQAGLQQLQWDNTIYEVCKIRAKEIATNWSHTRPNGGKYTDLINNLPWRSAGENLARGFTSASNVVSSWMESPGHKANILKSNYTHAAVAYHEGCWVTIFVEM